MTSDLRPLIISLKPCYADLLFEGLKRVELRRRIASQLSDRDVFIYVSSPVRELRGGFRVGQVWEGRPDDVWNIVAELATVDRKEFDAYFNGQTVAYALEVTNVWEYEDPKGLDWLRSRFGEFVVPQSWRYAKPEEHEDVSDYEDRRGRRSLLWSRRFSWHLNDSGNGNRGEIDRRIQRLVAAIRGPSLSVGLCSLQPREFTGRYR